MNKTLLADISRQGGHCAVGSMLPTHRKIWRGSGNTNMNPVITVGFEGTRFGLEVGKRRF